MTVAELLEAAADVIDREGYWWAGTHIEDGHGVCVETAMELVGTDALICEAGRALYAARPPKAQANPAEATPSEWAYDTFAEGVHDTSGSIDNFPRTAEQTANVTRALREVAAELTDQPEGQPEEREAVAA